MAVSRDPEILALRALVKVLFDAVSDTHENELSFHDETRRRAERLIDSYTGDLPPHSASVLRVQAAQAVSAIMADRPGEKGTASPPHP